MHTAFFPNHSLEELSELGLLQRFEIAALKENRFNRLNEILDYYEQYQTFSSLPGITHKSSENLDDLAAKFVYEQNHEYTSFELLSDSFHKEGSFFAPLLIDWKQVSERNKTFLDTWINYVVNWYEKPEIIPAGYCIVFESQLGWEKDAGYLARRKELCDFMDSFFGKEIDAKKFYEKAILHPEPTIEKYPEGHNISKCLFYLRSSFLKFYKATQVFSDPFDLLRFFARNEFFISTDDEIYAAITDHQTKFKRFPFAKAVYSIISKSSFFNRRRGLQDINMERFVSIFNKDPYGYGILNHLFGMSQAAFDKLKSDSDAVAETGCRITIAVLKALGFTHYYPENPYKDGKQLNPVLISNINYLEGLYLPEGFYGLLFSDLNDIQLNNSAI